MRIIMHTKSKNTNRMTVSYFMKKYGALFLMLITCLFILTACGSSKYVGEWQPASIITNEGKETDIASLSSIYADSFVTLTLEKNGTATMKLGDTTSEAEWETIDDGIKVFETDNENNSTTYTFKDDCLFCNFGAGEMKLEKK